MPEPQSSAPTTAWIPGSRPGMTKTGEQGGTPNPQPERRHPAHASPRLPTHFPRAEAKQRYREPNTPSPPPHFVILGPDPRIHARTAIICADDGMDTPLRAGHDKIRDQSGTCRPERPSRHTVDRCHPKTTVLCPFIITRFSRCSFTARARTRLSMSRPVATKSSAVMACVTRSVSCSMIGPSSRSGVT